MGVVRKISFVNKETLSDLFQFYDGQELNLGDKLPSLPSRQAGLGVVKTLNSYSRILFTFLLSISFFLSHAQTHSVKATLDTNQILIGDWIKLTLTLNTSSKEVVWPQLLDSVSAFEIIEKSKIDTISNNGNNVYQQDLTITSFDSGYYVIEPIKFQVKTGSGLDSVLTEPLLVTVNTVPIDTSKFSLNPIKEPLEVPLTFKEVLPYLIGALIVLAIALGIYLWMKNREKPEVVEKLKPKEPAHVIAINKLKLLEEEKLWQKGDSKGYYSGVSDIIREYIELRYHKPALESTTDEILEVMNRTTVDVEPYNILKEMLFLSDLVKFAKAKPLPDEHEKVLKDAYQFVELTKEINKPKEEKDKEGEGILE